MNTFKVGSEVVWSGRKGSECLFFDIGEEKFLNSKKVHTIVFIDDDNTCMLKGSQHWFDLDWLELVKDGEIVDESIKEQIKSNTELLNLKDKKQRKLKVLKEHKEWLEYQLEVLNDTEWVSCKDKYKINSNTSTEVALMMANGYDLVLELKKELTRVKLAIINLD